MARHRHKKKTATTRHQRTYKNGESRAAKWRRTLRTKVGVNDRTSGSYRMIAVPGAPAFLKPGDTRGR